MSRAGRATKRVGPMVDLLICVFFVVCLILASTTADKNEHVNTDPKKTEDDSWLSRNSKESKLSTHRDENNDLLAKSRTQSAKDSNDNSALSRFLEDVLRAQDDLKWIDQAVRGVNPGKDSKKSPSTSVNQNSESSHKEGISSSVKTDRGSKPRKKRGFDQNYEEMWTKKKYENKDSPEMPQRVYLDNDIPFKNDIDFADIDGMNGKEVPSPLKNKLSGPVYEKGTIDDQPPKDWTKTEDICSLSDWLNSNKEPETAHEKRGDRWIRDFEASQGDRPSSDEKFHARYNVRSQRDEAKKDEAPTLESLKQTVLELKKSLNEADRVHENSKNVDSAKAKEERKERRSHDKSKHRTDEKDDEEESNWWEASGSKNYDLKKREEAARDLDKNAQLKVWRTKRTEQVNNDDGNLKLFHRAGFGDPYLEEKALKELHDRRRRSKGTPSDEKRYSNEPSDKNNLEFDEKNSNKPLKGSSCSDIDDSSKKELSSNDLQRKMTNDVVQSSLTQDSNTMGNRLTKDERKGENLEVNPSQNFGPTTNEVQPAFAKASSNLKTDEREEPRESKMKKTENQEVVGSDEGEQLIKVLEPQARLYQTDERTKEVQGIAPDEEDRKKLPQQLSEGKRSPDGPGNINILLKSENKNLIEFSNADNSEKFSKSGKQQPFVMNRFDVKKKLIMENEEKPGKSVSTVFNVKIEKAQIDTGVKAEKKRENVKGGNGAQVFDLGKNKPNEELYKDAPELTSDLKQRNVDEERLKNSVEFDKGSAQSGDNEGGRNWYEGVVRNQMGMNIDQSGAEKYKEEGEKDKFGNEEERFREDKKKGGSIEDSNDGAASNDENSPSQDDKVKDDDDKSRQKYREIFVVTNGMDDRKINDRYVQRRMLQYMEYSNDDVEDADVNYGDKEEEENQQQAGAAGSNVPVRRKERSSSKGNPVKAKLNVMIKNKIDNKEKKTRRKRREPDVIEYYDYDSDMEQGDHDAVSAARDQETAQSNRDENAIESNLGLAESQKGTQACPPFAKKEKNMQEEEVLKQEKEMAKLNNKAPQQQFIVTLGKTRPKNVTGKTRKPSTDASRLSSKVTLAEEEGPSMSKQQPGRLNQPLEGKEEKLPAAGNARETMAKNPEKCVSNKYLDSGVLDDFLEDIQLMDQKNGKVAQDVEPLYEELKKLYDWSDTEWKSKPRIKGDQRMYYIADDKVDSMNTVDESFKDQLESPEIQSQSESSDSSPNLLPLLLAQGGQESSEIPAKPNPTVSSERLESPGASNVSQSNYFALKSTDDMFKGGSEQSNSTEEKLRGASPIGAAVQRPTQKVNGMKNDAVAEKYPASWSLTDRRQYVDTDSRSPYENRKYLESQQPRERVQNTDREKRMVISSRDLHESFVEPLDWIDDFDKDIRVRLSRGLKTVEDMNSNLVTNANIHVISNVTKTEDHNEERSSTAISEKDSTETAVTASVSGSSELGSIVHPSSNLQSLPGMDNIRVRRGADDSYETFYDDMNEHQRNSEKTDYGRYSKNTEAVDNRFQLLNSYEDVDDIRDRFSKPNAEAKEQDSPEEEDEDIDYKKVARSANSKGRKHKKKKKRHRNSVKKQKRKGHEGKPKYSNSRRKRRNHKKHSDSKTKNHEYDQKKHKKRTSKSANRHTSVKKSKAPRNEEKAHEVRHEPSVSAGKAARGKMESEDTMNPDDDFHGKRISMLLAADNIEDESQMDSALHGELAGKIVEHIFEQVQSKENLKVSLGPGLYQRHKTDDAIAADKRYRQSINDDEIKHTEELLEKVMLLLNRLIFDEVQRKTCVSLSSDMVEFLDWMLDVNPQETLIEQIPSLPLVHEESTPDHFPRDKFLFQGLPDQEMETDIVELRKKLRLIESLIREYGALSEKEKAKVQSVHDYLAKQLDLLLEYIDAKEEAGKKGKSSPSMGTTRVPAGRILQYQTGMRNATNGSYLRGPDHFSPFANVPNFFELSNASILKDGDYFHDNSIDLRHKRHRAVRSLDNHAKQHKKHRKRRKRKKKHRKRHKSANAIDQSRHKGTVHKAAASRHKRGYLDKDFWEFLDSGYEKPLIYSSMDMTNLKSNANDGEPHTEEHNFGDTVEKKPRYWKDVPIKGIDQSCLNELPRASNSLKKRETAGVIKDLSTSAIQGTNTAATDKKVKETVPNLNTENGLDQNDKDSLAKEEEPITGKTRLEDEVLLLNKRQAWKKENEEQLEEVAFGEDMRKGMRDKELFEKLTEMDKKKSASESNERSKRKDKKVENDVPLISSSTRQANDLKEEREQSYGFNDCVATGRNNGSNLSSEDKLKMLEAKINVYADNDSDTRRVR